MTDYYPHHSSYDHHQQALSGHSISYAGDPTEDNGIRRTATHGSHQSHHTPESHASISASTRSWVYSNQVNPPPPPSEPAPSVGHTPFHGPRPLPEPNAHYMTRRPFHDVPEEDEDDEDYTHQPRDTRMLGGLHFAYQTQPGLPAGYPIAGPSSLPSAQSSPVPPPQIPRRDRTFVGGFFKGIKRIPRMFRGGRNKRQLSPLGTEANTDVTGNTLPRYLSNPSIGPTNPQFAHRLSQAVANGSLPADITPAAFQLRPALVSPQQPMVTITPASDIAEEEQQAEYFEGPAPPQIIVTDSSDHISANPMGRATVLAYSRDSEAPTVTQTHPTSSARVSAPHRSPSVPRVSYPAELPTRASAQAQMESFAPIPVAGSSTGQMTSPLRSLHRPTTQSFASSRQTPRGILSPPATSAYTVTTATSYYDPSFSSDLTPVEKFFKSLYHLPWVSQGRVTVDYRPGDSPRAKGKLKSLKRPLSSWYYSVMSRSRRNSVDLMSSNTASTGRESNMLSSLASPSSRHSGRSANHRHRSPRPKHHHRSRRRHTASTSTGVGAGTHRSASPIVPTTYPYAVPPYLPYTYPYLPYTGVPPAGTMPATTPPHSPSSAHSPRGPRAARSHSRKGSSGVKYPHGGYTPFQPLVMPQPSAAVPNMAGVPAGGMYYISPSPPQSQNGDGTAGYVAAATTGTAAGPIQFSPVFMHYVPAALRPDAMVSPAAANMMVSPPATPQKPTAASHNSHHSRHA